MTNYEALPSDGEGVGFEAFVSEHAVGLGRLAYLMCGSAADADDVVQDALVRLYAAWPRVAPPARLSYTRRIVARQASNHRRSTAREIPSDALPDHYESSRVDPTDLVALRRAIAALPGRQRAVVALRYYADLPEAEIAAALGVRVGTVKSQLSRATTTLRRLLEAPEPLGRNHP